MNKIMIIIAVSISIIAICVFGWILLSNSSKTVGKNIKEEDFGDVVKAVPKLWLQCRL